MRYSKSIYTFRNDRVCVGAAIYSMATQLRAFTQHKIAIIRSDVFDQSIGIRKTIQTILGDSQGYSIYIYIYYYIIARQDGSIDDIEVRLLIAAFIAYVTQFSAG